MSNDWYCLKDILEIVSEIIGEPLLGHLFIWSTNED